MRVPTGRYTQVRYREDTGFELRCADCESRHDANGYWWPLTLEFWNPKPGMNRCRACWFTYWRQKNAAYRKRNPEAQRARERRYYRENRAAVLIKQRERDRAKRAAA